jgi:hypothetical protein
MERRMEFRKQIIADIFKCYSVNALSINGETHLLFAGEGPGICQAFSGRNFIEKKTLWEGGGGVMSIVTVPDYEGYFFASKGFYSMVDAETSGVYLVRYKGGEFIEERIIDLPYLHRFDVIHADGKRYFIGAALHSGKEDKGDWSKPGKIFVAEIPQDLNGEIQVELTLLKEGLTKNHGFNKGVWGNRKVAFVASDEGVFAVIPPAAGSAEWTMEQIFSHPVSDVAAIDLDGDGEVEFALLSPFHGNQFDIYKKVGDEYRSVFQYPRQLDFYHAIFADTFNGVPSVVIGARKEDMDLFLVQYDKNEKRFTSHLVDTEVGPSNARIVHTENGDILMSANRQIGQAAIYR